MEASGRIGRKLAPGLSGRNSLGRGGSPLSLGFWDWGWIWGSGCMRWNRSRGLAGGKPAPSPPGPFSSCTTCGFHNSAWGRVQGGRPPCGISIKKDKVLGNRMGNTRGGLLLSKYSLQKLKTVLFCKNKVKAEHLSTHFF